MENEGGAPEKEGHNEGDGNGASRNRDVCEFPRNINDGSSVSMPSMWMNLDGDDAKVSFDVFGHSASKEGRFKQLYACSLFRLFSACEKEVNNGSLGFVYPRSLLLLSALTQNTHSTQKNQRRNHTLTHSRSRILAQHCPRSSSPLVYIEHHAKGEKFSKQSKRKPPHIEKSMGWMGQRTLEIALSENQCSQNVQKSHSAKIYN